MEESGRKNLKKYVIFLIVGIALFVLAWVPMMVAVFSGIRMTDRNAEVLFPADGTHTMNMEPGYYLAATTTVIHEGKQYHAAETMSPAHLKVTSETGQAISVALASGSSSYTNTLTDNVHREWKNFGVLEIRNAGNYTLAIEPPQSGPMISIAPHNPEGIKKVFGFGAISCIMSCTGGILIFLSLVAVIVAATRSRPKPAAQ